MGRHEHPHRDPAVRLAVGLLLFVFLFRALIPAGFMPDAKALAQGHFELVICSPAGGAAAPGGEGPEKWAGAECPYYFALSYAFVAGASPPIAVEFASRAAHGFAASIVLLPPALGPPLGSRAPPAVFA